MRYVNEIEDIIGQEHLFSNNGPLYKMISNNNYSSFVLFGPSGCGKTTIANLIAKKSNKDVFNLNAVKISKGELSEVLKNYQNQEIVIIVDEVHRLDKQKQNLFLPYLEKENIILIGTTTENPTYTLHNAFLSRVFLFELYKLGHNELYNFLVSLNTKYYEDNIFSAKLLEQIIAFSGNDLRKCKHYFEFLVKNYKEEEVDAKVLNTILKSNMKYEADGNRHYDLISALQKSIRASDVNASIFYLGHLLLSGDHNAILRRLCIIAYEDIGIANSNLTNKVYNAVELFKQVGMPEGRIILANIVIELALSPKSKTAYLSLDRAIESIKRNPNYEIPAYIRQDSRERGLYSEEKAFYSNNLPQEFKESEYLEFMGDSTYEQALEKRYIQLKEMKNGKNI